MRSTWVTLVLLVAVTACARTESSRLETHDPVLVVVAAPSLESEVCRGFQRTGHARLASGPLAWLADILARIQDHPAKRIDELLPWNWQQLTHQQRAAA